jgi:hypothetical protein
VELTPEVEEQVRSTISRLLEERRRAPAIDGTSLAAAGSSATRRSFFRRSR